MRRLISLAATMVVSCALATSAQDLSAPPPVLPAELVRQTVANETKRAPETWHFTYRDVKKKAHGPAETKQMVETRDGMIGRIIALDGEPLTPEQRASEDRRLQRLLDDPQQLAQKQKEQKQDEERVRSMVKALPDAFLYQYAGTEESSTGTLVKLAFEPNPAFTPTSRELQVYQGMKGYLLIHNKALRVVRIEATLFRDVNFGWGILGHLDKGGHFTVEQNLAGDDDWEVTSMDLKFTGKLLLFKSLNIQQHETASGFRRVPSDLGLAQALEMLKEDEAAYARQNGMDKSPTKATTNARPQN